MPLTNMIAWIENLGLLLVDADPAIGHTSTSRSAPPSEGTGRYLGLASSEDVGPSLDSRKISFPAVNWRSARARDSASDTEGEEDRV